MKSLLSILCLGLAVTLTSTGFADEAAAQKGKGKGKKTPSVTQRFVGKMDLTAEQKEKVAAIDKEFAEAFVKLNKEKAGVLTEEQAKAEKDANAANKTAGRKGAEARKAVEEALKLTDEQKVKIQAWQKSQAELNGKVITALKSVLTEEQQKLLPKTGGTGKKKKNN